MPKLFRRILVETKGFSLLETIIAVILIGFFINGLFLAWQVTDSRQRALDAYWQAKEQLEIAFETTQRVIRANAKSNFTILSGGTGISFTGTDGLNWQFLKSGNSYLKIHNGQSETLLDNDCSQVNFELNGKMVEIELAVNPPVFWNGNSDDLLITGKALFRN